MTDRRRVGSRREQTVADRIVNAVALTVKAARANDRRQAEAGTCPTCGHTRALGELLWDEREEARASGRRIQAMYDADAHALDEEADRG